MDIASFKYRATFTSVAKVASPTSEDRFVAKAALAPLKGLLPQGVDPQDSPDLLMISCNGAVAGLANRNGDCISTETALAINASSKHKYISTDHDRTKVVGVILYPGFSTFGTNEPLTYEAAAALKEPFNMAFVGALWKTISPMLSKYITNVGDDTGQDAMSMSWEIAFSDYSLMVGSENTFDAEIVPPTDPRFAAIDKMLRANGGEGKDTSGRMVSRLITGEPVILGYSVVPNPAAHVRGIIPIEKLPEPPSAGNALSSDTVTFLQNEPEAGAGYHLCDITMKDGKVYNNVAILDRGILPAKIDAAQVASVVIHKKNDEKNITPEKPRVTKHTIKAMKISIASVEELSSKWDEISALPKNEALASIADLVKAIEDGSTKFAKELKAKEDLVKSAEESQAAAVKRAEKLEADFAKLRDELAEVKASAEANEASSKFNERMASFDNDYNLDDEDRKFIAADIKDLDDAGFETYAAKQKKLMGGKKKAAKPAPGDDDKDDKSKALFNDSSKKSKSDDDDTDASAKASAKAAFASVVEDTTQAKLPNATVVVDATIHDTMKAAFGSSFKINGQTVAERNEKKNKK